MPEAIFDDATPDNLARLLTRLLLNPSECKHQVMILWQTVAWFSTNQCV